MTEEHTRVVVAGGGMAGVEALLALRASGAAALDLVLLAPEEHLVYAPLAVAEPFGGAPVRHYALDAIARDAGAVRVAAALAQVSPRFRTLLTTTGAELAYDELIVAVGAQRRAAHPSTLTFTGPQAAGALAELLAGVRARDARSIAFVVPPGPTWPLPAYELALAAAQRLDGPAVSVSTAEETPLGCFGPRVSAFVRELLDDAGIAVCCAATEPPGTDLEIALPVLSGPRLRGLPRDADGFIPVEADGRVAGLDVYAAGDGTSHPLKHGGVATQVADAAAAAIAQRNGAAPAGAPEPIMLRAMLLTPVGPRYLQAIPGEPGTDSVSERCPWDPPAKVAGRHLARFLAERDAAGAYTTLPVHA